ncbi:MAG: SgcJ/EcaC family oxidoreductase [Leptolyngbyaceae cyanobacterium bins.349]|nr:SgcJ/EcaC family oxidoreductase [Leptolyngbyaceae cyanobacterium bins.349]
MSQHPVELLIQKADQAINQEDFDTLMDIYAEDAVLVIKPGVNAIGKAQIKEAMKRIADYFEHTLDVKQAAIKILNTGDTALVLAKTIVAAKNHPTTERQATYVFKQDINGNWLCVIDNSYGQDLLETEI